jgi:hypothetical protein
LKYLIHIGPHKTGTTALQAGFKHHRNDLLNRGILYPEQWDLSTDNSTHMRLVDRLRRCDKLLEQEFNALNNSKYSYVLISSEDLVDLPLDSVIYFKHIVGRTPVDIIFYCRNWSSLLQSASQETVKQGYSTTLPEFFVNEVLGAWESNVINFNIVLEKYSKAFREAKIRLVSYDEVANQKISLLRHFLKTFADWNDCALTEDSRLNQSLSPVQVETIRILNAMEWARYKRRGIELRDQFLLRESMLELGPMKESMNRHLSYLEFDEGSPPFASLHRHIFDVFGAGMVNPRPPLGLFQPQKKRIPYVAEGYLFEAGVLPAFNELYRLLSERNTGQAQVA